MNRYKNNYFNFKKFEDKYLITNDTGQFMFINDNNLRKLITHNIDEDTVLTELEDKFFIYRDKDSFVKKASDQVRKNKIYFNEGTQLHIFVLTTYCNLSCIYCQASTYNDRSTCKNNKFMSKEIAERAVDIAMQSPSNNLTFEFQGGEPLANFEVIKHIVAYSQEKNKELGKNIEFSLVSNLTLANEEIIKFLILNNIGIATSIDGPQKVHNFNRNYKYNNSLKVTKEKINLINQIAKCTNTVQAIETTSNFSLNYSHEIVDEYIRLNMKVIFIRPLTPIGYAATRWNSIGYTAEQFLKFYRESFDYIILKALSGVKISEGHAVIFLKKILKNIPINYMELRSPCGGAIGQIAYNYDGNIYNCDEGRMLSEMGDNSFKLGNVYNNNLKSLLVNPTCKTIATASCLESIPGCEQCVYQPYCGVCPVCNYQQYNNLFAPNLNSYRCKIYKGILDILFSKIKENDKQVIDLFYSWIE